MISQETLQKYLDGDATAEERGSVDNWRGQSLQNELQFQKFESYYLTGVLPENEAEPIGQIKFWKKRYLWFFIGVLIISYCIAIISSSQRVFLNKVGGKDTSILIKGIGTIRLNEGSVLTYPEVFDGNYNKVFIKGDAYFYLFEECESFVIENLDSRVKVIEFPSEFSITSFGRDSVQLVVDEGEVLWDCDSDLTHLKSGMSVIWNIKINQFDEDFNYYSKKSKK